MRTLENRLNQAELVEFQNNFYANLQKKEAELEAEKESFFQRSIEGRSDISQVKRLYKLDVVVKALREFWENATDTEQEIPVDILRHNNVEFYKEKIYNWVPNTYDQASRDKHEWELHAWRRIVNILLDSDDITACNYTAQMADIDGNI